MRHVFQSGTTTRPHYSRKGRDSGSSLYLVQGADDQTARRRRAVPTLHLPEVRVPARHEVGEEIAEDCSCVPASTDEEDQVAWSIAPAPLGATLPGFSSWKPSGIPAAAVCDRGALVSSSFPSRKSLGGSPLLRRSPLTPCHPFLSRRGQVACRPVPLADPQGHWHHQPKLILPFLFIDRCAADISNSQTQRYVFSFFIFHFYNFPPFFSGTP